MSWFSRAQQAAQTVQQAAPKQGPSGTTILAGLAVACLLGAFLWLNWSGTITIWQRAVTSSSSVDTPTPAVPVAPAAPAGGGPAQIAAWGDGLSAWAEAAAMTALKALGWMAVGLGLLGLFLHHTHAFRRFGWALLVTAAFGMVGDLVGLVAVSHLVAAGMSAATSPTLGR